MRVKCLAQDHNTRSIARSRTPSACSRVEHTNHEATAPPRGDSISSGISLFCQLLFRWSKSAIMSGNYMYNQALCRETYKFLNLAIISRSCTWIVNFSKKSCIKTGSISWIMDNPIYNALHICICYFTYRACYTWFLKYLLCICSLQSEKGVCP